MPDRSRFLFGLVPVAALAFQCTPLDSGSDRFSVGGSGVGGSVGGATFAGTGGGGADAGTAGQDVTASGGASAGSGGTASMPSAGGHGGARAGTGGSSTGAAGSGADTSEGGAAGESGSPGQSSGGEAGAGTTECVDPTGFSGLGCYRCAPTDVVTLEQACTNAVCTHFDNATRLTLLPSDGHLPELPSSGGAGGAGTAGAANAGASSGGAGAGGGAGTTGTAGATGGAGAGGAGYACSDLTGLGRVVYVTGSSAAKPFLQQIAQQLATTEVYVVYTSTGSCVGVDAVVNGTPMKTGASPAPAATATYWDNSSSPGKPCDLPAEGVSADLGISDVFAATCPTFEYTDLDALHIRDAHGPIQTMTFAVPTNSPYSELSAQAAYFVFGFGAAGGVLDPEANEPAWNDESYLFQRSSTSGTQTMLAKAIGLAAGSWKGKPNKTSDDLASALQAAGASVETAKKALGILAADYIDTKNLRAQIKVLAFQDTHQPCAVFPDSTSSAHDKQNVRDGHYPVWSPLHLLYRTDQAGNPLNEQSRQAVSDIIGYLSGTKALPNGVKLLDVYAQSGLVPECAMQVTRTADGGQVTRRRPPAPCSCVFELKATGATSCSPCAVQGDCPAGTQCSQGYCEP